MRNCVFPSLGLYTVHIEGKAAMRVKTVSYRSPNAGREFAESLRETGFAVVSDHPISAELIFNTFREWEGFFASDEKHKYTFNPADQAGYFPFRTENAKDYSK